MSNLQDMTIAELELRIKLGNMMLHWLRSKDPMLTQDEYRPLVNPTIDRLTAEVREMIVVCREKKVARQQIEDEFVEHVQVGLKPGRLNIKKL